MAGARTKKFRERILIGYHSRLFFAAQTRVIGEHLPVIAGKQGRDVAFDRIDGGQRVPVILSSKWSGCLRSWQKYAPIRENMPLKRIVYFYLVNPVVFRHISD